MKHVPPLHLPILCFLVVTGASLAAAQGTPAGVEFQINTDTTSSQREPDVTRDDLGRFVVVWDVPEIRAQRFDASGMPLGAELQINTFTTGTQYQTAVSSAPNGDFIVVWTSYGSSSGDTSGTSIQGRRYSSDGSPLSGQFQVNSYTTSYQYNPDIDVDDDGDFVVTWESPDGSLSGIRARRFDSGGASLGADFQVNAYTTGGQLQPAIASESNGDFTLIWTSEGSTGTDSSGRSIQGQRFASTGSPIGGQFQVNTSTMNSQTSPAVASDPDGHLVVTWSSNESGGTDSDLSSVQGQRFSSDGAAAGAEFQVNTYTTSSQIRPAVTMDAGGNFVIVWEFPEIHGQSFAADGMAVGSEFQINTYTTSAQTFAAVAADPSGNFIVVYQSSGSPGTDSSGSSILGQRYEGPVPVELQSFTVIDDSESAVRENTP